VNCKESLQNVVQHLFLCGNAGHNFVHLGNYSAEEGDSAEEENDAVDLRQWSLCQAKIQRVLAARPDSVRVVHLISIAPDRD
jgi:hypothetical protein